MTDRPTLRIDLESPVPAYRQIADALRALLVGGEIRPGDYLPTIRELAVDLGIHKNTIAEAYRLLAAEGWLELRRRHGARVLDRAVPQGDTEAVERFSQRLRELVAEALAAGVDRATAGGLLKEVAHGLQGEGAGSES